MTRAFLAALTLLCFFQTTLAQDSSMVDKIGSFSDKFFNALNKRTTSLEARLTRQTEKYLRRLEKKEQKLKSQLYQLDSNKTKNLFLLNTDQQYAAYLSKMRSDTARDPSSLRGTYMANADTIQGALAFLKQNPSLLNGSNVPAGQVQELLAKFNSLEAKMNDADQLQQFIKERKEQIKQYLMQFVHLPPGIRAIYNDYNQEYYYYTQQVKQYKDLLDDPDKLIKATVDILQKMPMFQSFIQKNSILASLFPTSSVMGGPQGIPGLQTRGATSQLIMEQLSGPNAQQTVSGSRLTWQAPQEVVGLVVGITQSTFGLVNNVSYFDGATVLNATDLTNSTENALDNNYGGHSASAVTFGSIIFGPSHMRASPNDPTFVHEYGRYLQSQAEGFIYLGYTAIPNFFGGGNDDATSHDANARAFIYFTKNYGGLNSWLYDQYIGNTGNSNGFYWDFNNGVGSPIPGYDPTQPFNSPSNQAALMGNMRNIW